MAAEVDDRMQVEEDVSPALADLASPALWLGVVASSLLGNSSFCVFSPKSAPTVASVFAFSP